jgi:hypothetical protein
MGGDRSGRCRRRPRDGPSGGGDRLAAAVPSTLQPDQTPVVTYVRHTVALDSDEVADLRGVVRTVVRGVICCAGTAGAGSPASLVERGGRARDR